MHHQDWLTFVLVRTSLHLSNTTAHELHVSSTFSSHTQEGAFSRMNRWSLTAGSCTVYIWLNGSCCADAWGEHWILVWVHLWTLHEWKILFDMKRFHYLVCAELFQQHQNCSLMRRHMGVYWFQIKHTIKGTFVYFFVPVLLDLCTWLHKSIFLWKKLILKK